MKLVVALSVLFALAVSGTEEKSFFQSVPSDDYYRRNNVFDCASRYYGYSGFDAYNMMGYNVVYGFVTDKPSLGVAGGKRAFDGEFPHMVAIGWEFIDGIKYQCGGSIIHSKFVLTAAHCSVPVKGVFPTTVRAGDSDLDDTTNDHLAQQRNISRILRHPLHRHSRSYHDIALIELESDLVFNFQISPACLWLETHIPVEPLHIVGFGEVKLADGHSLALQKGHVIHHPSDACEETLTSRRRIPDGLLESQFCAAHDTMDTCQGDSGGPIEVRKFDMLRREIPLIVGITSFGTACGSGSIGVYTKIANYVDWIEQETNQSYSYDKCTSRRIFTKTKDKETTQLTTNETLPYVHLMRDQSTDRAYDCMGTLIDDQFVVTSAYCATHPAGAPQFIYIAANDEYVEIDEVITHPQYVEGDSVNNIALIKLSKFLKQGLKPACLTQGKYLNPKLSFMMKAFVTIAENRSIEHFFRTLQPENDQCPALTNEICVKSSFPVIPGICHLTDGAPILIDSSIGLPLLYGMISSKNSKCDGELHGTLIEPHRGWIRTVLLRYQRTEVLIFF